MCACVDRASTLSKTPIWMTHRSEGCPGRPRRDGPTQGETQQADVLVWYGSWIEPVDDVHMTVRLMREDRLFSSAYSASRVIAGPMTQ